MTPFTTVEEWAVRRLSGFLAVLLTALGGGCLAWPDQFVAHWRDLANFAERQLAAELATFDQLTSGKLTVDAPSSKRTQNPPPIMARTEKDSSPPPKQAKLPEIVKPARALVTATTAPARDQPPPQNGAPVVDVPPDTTPEAALGAILKHEIRENQAKEETFWTQERIQEALRNGAPKSRSAPCIAYCGNNNTEVEINMPKQPSESPKKQSGP